MKGRTFFKKMLMTASLLCGLFSLVTVTYAWMDRTISINNRIDITSGESAAYVEGYVYTQNYTYDETTGHPNPEGYYKNNGAVLLEATQADLPDAEGVFLINFSDTITSSTAFDLATTVEDEYVLDAQKFPRYYVELKFFKENYDAYIRASMVYTGLPASRSGYVDLSSEYLFDYRMVTVNNDVDHLYYSGLDAARTSFATMDRNQFFSASSVAGTDSVSFFNANDLVGAPIDPATADTQCYLPAFPLTDAATGEMLFTKSHVLEISLNPIRYLQYYKNNPLGFNENLQFGINFQINVEISSIPFVIA